MESKTTTPIIRGTTPTIRYTFKNIDTADIRAAYLVIQQNGNPVITKGIANASIEEGSVTWKLGQQDTLCLKHGVTARICCDWLLNDGTRGVGRTVEAPVISSAMEGVLE